MATCDAAARLCDFINASPSPFHVADHVARHLEGLGFTRLDETRAWPTEAGKYVVVRSGSVIAWTEPSGIEPAAGFDIVAGHTDSPNLRVKAHAQRTKAGSQMIALEPYGGPLLESWLDRDLGFSGRIVDVGGREALVRTDEAVARVPRLAIHLDRDGDSIDRQNHLDALWLGPASGLVEMLAQEAGLGDVAGFELMTHDVNPARLIGASGEGVSAPRLDNQTTCFAAMEALTAVSGTARTMMVLYDHEEVGSGSARGAQSPFLTTVIERIVVASGGSRDDLHRCLADSVMVSGDMAHATHPNYAAKHEPGHQISAGAGPVLKINQNLRYATDARGAAIFASACQLAGVAMQEYVHRADLPCGSTIGPLSAAQSGILTVDVGAPQLAMHSAREYMAAADVASYVAALSAFLRRREVEVTL